VRLIEAIEAQRARLESARVSFGHGTDNAFDEAAWLALGALGLAPDALDDDSAEHLLSTAELARIVELTDRRIATRQPTAYLLGEAWLQGVPFDVDARAIVPRSLIAEPLGDGTLDAWLVGAPRRLLDLCTGNGSLAVLEALAWPEARIEATDLSADALAVAQRNLQRHGLAERIRLIESDLYARIDGHYDLILCNPPYVNAGALAALPPEYRAEPRIALDGNVAGGRDGMDLVRRIVADAAAHLEADGALVLEIGHERDHFERAFPRLEAVWLPTEAGDDQVLLLTREALLRGAAG
jgi:ribosomal protein L3 glutamine methyltransferase